MSHQATHLSTASRYLKRIWHWEPGRLAILFIGAIAITLLITDHNAIAEGMFQSPPDSPPAEQQQPAQEQQPAQQQPAQQPAQEQQQQQQPAEQQPAQQQQPGPEVVSPVSPAASEPTLPAGSQPPPLPQPTADTRPVRLESDLALEEEEPSNFILDQVEMVDTIVVSGAYIWLCCGAVLFLLIPLFFLFLQIRGQIKIQREENL